MGGRTGDPRTALEALPWPRLLVSSWPWRSLGYLLTTLPVAVPAFAVLAIPWLVATTQLTADDRQVSRIVVLFLLGAGLVAALGPLIAPPLARLDRRRLCMVDTRPAVSAPGGWAPGPGPGCAHATPTRPPGGRSATPA